MLAKNVPDEGYYKKASCALNQICMFSITHVSAEAITNGRMIPRERVVHQQIPLTFPYAFLYPEHHFIDNLWGTPWLSYITSWASSILPCFLY